METDNDEEKFSADDVAMMLTNPAYAGVGKYPPITPDDLWAKAAVVGITQHGLDDFWSMVKLNLETYLGFDGKSSSAICEKYKKLYQERNNQQVILDFLAELRQVAAG